MKKHTAIRICTLLLCLMLPMGTLAQDGGATEAPEATEAPAVTEAPEATEAPVPDMTMMGFDAQSSRTWEDNLFFERMQEQTGLSFAFEQYTEDEPYAKAKAALATREDLPDVLFKADLTAVEERELADAGVLIDLKPLLEEHAPNLWALLTENPEWLEAISLPDGRIVSLPQISDPSKQVCLWINRAWLDQLKLTMPTNTEEFTEVLRAFKEGDPNANYNADEIPLMMIGPWELKWLMHGFGLTGNDYNVYLDESGQVQYTLFEAEYYDFLAYAKSLLEEGLLSSDALRSVYSLVQSEHQEEETPRIGSLLSMAPYTLLSVSVTAQYDAVPPFTYEGEQVWRDYLGDVWRGTFAITSACEDPAAALAWVDYLYTEEGARLAYLGLENVDWAYTDEPYWTYLIDDYRSFDSISGEALIFNSAMQPGIYPKEMTDTVDDYAERHSSTQNASVAEVSTMPLPQLSPDADQLARITELQNELGMHVDTMVAKFISGERELNAEEFAAFQQELRDLGAEQLCTLWQEVYDGRYTVE